MPFDELRHLGYTHGRHARPRGAATGWQVPPVIGMLASALVFLTGLYFIGLAAVSFLAPARATRFLLSFARSAGAHYLEMLIRILVGGAIVLHAPHMQFAGVFAFFGWALVITSVGLLAVPWRWHQRFAQRVVPYVVRNLTLVAITSLLFGGFIVAALVRGPA